MAQSSYGIRAFSRNIRTPPNATCIIAHQDNQQLQPPIIWINTAQQKK